VLMYITLQGDRLLVANGFDDATMGDYAVAVALTLQPAMILNSVVSSVLLPTFSSKRGNRKALLDAYRRCFTQQFLLAAAANIAWVTCAHLIVTALYGARYQSASIFVIWLGAAQSFRVLRALPSTLGIALGDTKLNLYSNGLRATLFLCLWFFVLPHDTPVSVAQSIFYSELLAGVMSAWMLWRRHRVPWYQQISLMILLALIFATAMLVEHRLQTDVPGTWRIVAEVSLAGAAGLATAVATIGMLGWRRRPEIRQANG